MDSVDLNVLRSVLQWRRAGQRVMLYSVVQTWGSAPRPPGAMLALRGDGVVIGSVSGGCIEDDLIARLQDGRLPADGPPVQLVTYGVTRDEAARFGLPCGGTLRLTEERVEEWGWVQALLARCEDHQIVARELNLATGEVTLSAASKTDVVSFDGERLRAIYGPRWRLLLIVLGTSSSESALPRMLIKMERLGAKKSVVGLVIPTGYSFNLDGTSIYLTMAAVFIAQATDTHMDITHQITLLLVLLLSSKGAAGVTGSGFIVLAATLSAVGHLPVAGLALILGIDRFMSEARALTNLVGNAVATIVVAKWVKELDTDQLHSELASGGRAITDTRAEDDLGVAEGPAPAVK